MNKSTIRHTRYLVVLLGVPLAFFGFVVYVVLDKYLSQVWPGRQEHCINSLRKIETAKQQWAIKSNATPEASLSWDDIVGATSSIRKMPVCPEDGEYSIGTLREVATCSHWSPIYPHRIEP